jgi:hypothetical protein
MKNMISVRDEESGATAAGRGRLRLPRLLRSRLLLPALFALTFLPAAILAQEADDPFSLEEFNSGVQAAVESEESSTTEFLVGGTLVPSVTATVTGEWDGYAASGSLSGKVFAKATLADYGSLFASVGITQQFFQGRGGSLPGFSLGTENPLYAPTLTLTEMHWSFDIAKKLFVRFGNQLVAWGPSKIWSAVDFINLEKADAFTGVDLRVGKPGLRFHMPLDNSNLFAFADFSGTVEDVSSTSTPDYRIQDFFETTNLGLRYDLALSGFEFGFTGYGGADVQCRAGFDFSGRALGGTVYGEAAVLPAYGDYDFSWSAVAGIERKLGELKKATLSGEFFYNSLGADDESSYPAAWTDAGASFQPNYAGKYYAYSGLSLEDFLAEGLNSSLSVLSNLSDMSFSVRLTEAFDLPGVPPFSLILGWAGGGEKKAYTYFSDDNAVSLSLRSTISF